MYRLAVTVSLALLLPSCSNTVSRMDELNNNVRLLGDKPLTSGRFNGRQVNAISRADSDSPRSTYVELAMPERADSTNQQAFDIDASGKHISLNFVDAPLQEFVRVVFDEILRETAIVDSTLKGKITLRTQAPISRATALDLVRQALQANGASITHTASGYRIMAQSDSRSGKRAAESVRVIPLRYITSDEAKNALSAFGQSGVDISTGPGGRYVILAGSAAELDNIEQALTTLDVDQMKGMSFGLFPLREAGAISMANELNQMFGRPNDVGAFRAMPINRMNAILVVSTQPQLVDRARSWISRLDLADHDDRKIYVYAVQNRRAPEIAKILSVVLDKPKSPRQENLDTPVAPRLTAVKSPSIAPGANSFARADDAAAPNRNASVAAIEPDTKAAATGPRISADASTNSIVVTANVQEWKIIESALRQLDRMAPQVLIEATIAEVTLNNTLRHGVRWYFQKGAHAISLGDSSSAIGSPGFSYAFGLPNARVALTALEELTDVVIVSSPALTVLDNETAKLQVGDQVPISTRSARSVVTPDAPIVNDIEFKDTGVILSVTPHVNASGLVTLDIIQEVSDVVPTTTSNLDSPTIRQRRVNSSVSSYSGAEIVLGGLISTSRSKDDSGIPAVMNIPVVGNLFKSSAKKDAARTELVVILRPTVITSREDIKNITREIKARMAATVQSFRQH